MRKHKKLGFRTQKFKRLRQTRRAVTPNVITAFGLCCGLFIIFRSVLNISSPFTLVQQLQGLSLLLISAIVADFSDGAIARIMKAESSFGAHFDSLSDAITFGISPPLLAIKSLSEIPVSAFQSSFLLVCCMIYALCGVLRLVRYNIFSKNNPDDLHATFCFIGLPIPAAAAAITSLALLLTSNAAFCTPHTHILILAISMVFIGGLMVSPWKFPSLKHFRFKISSFFVIIVTGLMTCFFFLGLVDHFVEVFFLTSWSYIFLIFPAFSFLNKKG